ncbi:MAG: hypothetical protein OES93_05775 [Gammaproteobacteria bacterium]|jgi:hypothetical protein|nr:hypothetical protein [Gammaproteobacteria bacterium]
MYELLVAYVDADVRHLAVETEEQQVTSLQIVIRNFTSHVP